MLHASSRWFTLPNHRPANGDICLYSFPSSVRGQRRALCDRPRPQRPCRRVRVRCVRRLRAKLQGTCHRAHGLGAGRAGCHRIVRSSSLNGPGRNRLTGLQAGAYVYSPFRRVHPMADNPDQIQRAEESKKDTVRINLPPGLTGRGAPPSPSAVPPPPPKPKTPGPAVNPEEEAKKETAVMGRPAEAPKPKKDTSRVQVTAAKPAIAETPRPTVKLRREDEGAPPTLAPATASTTPGLKPPPATRPGPRPVAAAMAGAPSGLEIVLSLVALVLSLAVAGSLAFITFG